jgi:hypothetical protein
MRPLDRLFGTLPYPFDALLPSLVWLAFSAAAMAGMVALLRRRGHPAPLLPLRVGAWLALADVAPYLGFIAARSLAGGDGPPWLAALYAPFDAVRGALDALLWNAVGVSAAVAPRLLFKGYSSWDGRTSVAAANLLNEAALVALLAAAVTAAVTTYFAAARAPRR